MSRTMPIPRRLPPWPILLTTLVLLALPQLWAFPQELSFWRSYAIASGWVACSLLLASLLLMVREPWLARRLGGLEAMYCWHHRFGVVAYLLLLSHPLTLAADAWSESPARAWALLAPWQEGWAIWLGWGGLLGLMVGLAGAMAPRLAYRFWRRLHWLLALAVALGLAHLLVLGLDAFLLWVPLLALLLLAWRVLGADRGWSALPYVVEAVQRMGDDGIEARLRPLTRGLAARPGQFVLVAFFRGPHFRGCAEFHPFTLSDVAADGRITLGIRALGDCTRHLQALEPGVAVRVQGPFGRFLDDEETEPSLWIAGGIGITPFLARLRQGALTVPVRLVYLYRAAEAAYAAELDGLAAGHPDLRLQTVACDAQPPDLVRILPSAAELARHHCYLCGPPGMVQAAVEVLLARGVHSECIHFERFEFR